jgi:hypothetical protein
VVDDLFTEATWPGADTVGERADETCLDAFAGFVGESYDSSELDFVSLSPTEDSWSLGDRGVVCLVVQPDASGENLEQVTGSLRG